MPSNNMPAVGPKWVIVSANTTTARDDTGTFVPGRNVIWQTADGTTGTVFVPATKLTPEYVTQLVNADAAKVLSVIGLTSAG